MPAIKPDSTLLIDGNAYLYRFYHGSEPRYAQDGTPTHVIYRYMVYLRTCMFRYKPKRLIVVFDASGPTFRHELYQDYKAHRDPMPADLKSQISPIKASIKLMGIPVVELPEVEADDSLATLAKLYAEQGDMSYIFSMDKDLTQCVTDNVHLVHDRQKVIVDPDYIQKRYGVEPKQIIDLLALTGDSADNIPGVDGVGPKSAAKLLQTWGTIENIIKNMHWVKGKIGNNLRQSVDALKLSKVLTTIRHDLELPFELTQLELMPEDKFGITQFCDKYQLR
jgi:DNA polymerase I